MKLLALLAVSLVAMGAAGFLTAQALTNATAPPTETVTVNVATGLQGPKGDPGPPGPAGPAGSPSDCPAGYTFKAVTFIQQGAGPTTIAVCVKT